ncbi:hypothetical protein [Vibrio palustris]|uniref:Uncharacterized protein n=1 Tax=Vibrio palustris TaxID=1918946 RepID=A0A1R4B5T2_9VIBR|nr:hypothetical protein [Vibrio palustris]SJL84284.1 hypothetical protein VPAL9027_02266 [Vibrio palustris]
MIIWRGWGILVVLITMVMYMAVIFLGESIFHQGYAIHAQYYHAVATLLSAIAVWFTGRKLNGGQGRELLDEKTGQKVIMKSSHSLFFIKFEYWAIPLAILGLLFMIA